MEYRKMLDGQAFMNSKETALMLGIGESTLRGWRCRNENNLKFYRVGKNCKYALDDVRAYLEERINKKALRKQK